MSSSVHQTNFVAEQGNLSRKEQFEQWKTQRDAARKACLTPTRKTPGAVRTHHPRDLGSPSMKSLTPNRATTPGKANPTTAKRTPTPKSTAGTPGGAAKRTTPKHGGTPKKQPAWDGNAAPTTPVSTRKAATQPKGGPQGSPVQSPVRGVASPGGSPAVHTPAKQRAVMLKQVYERARQANEGLPDTDVLVLDKENSNASPVSPAHNAVQKLVDSVMEDMRDKQCSTPYRQDDETVAHENPLSTPRGAGTPRDRQSTPREIFQESVGNLPDYDESARSLSPSKSPAKRSPRMSIAQQLEAESAVESAVASPSPMLDKYGSRETPTRGSIASRPRQLIPTPINSAAKQVIGCSTVTSDMAFPVDFGSDVVAWTRLEKSSLPWDADDKFTACRRCTRSFTFLRRKHHCRQCGHIFCKECAGQVQLGVHGYTRAVRVCGECSSSNAFQGGDGMEATANPAEDAQCKVCVVQ